KNRSGRRQGGIVSGQKESPPNFLAGLYLARIVGYNIHSFFFCRFGRSAKTIRGDFPYIRPTFQLRKASSSLIFRKYSGCLLDKEKGPDSSDPLSLSWSQKP